MKQNEQSNVFAQRLHELMTLKGWGPSDLQIQAGVSQSNVSRWLNGQGVASLEALIRLSKASNKPLEWFLSLSIGGDAGSIILEGDDFDTEQHVAHCLAAVDSFAQRQTTLPINIGMLARELGLQLVEAQLPAGQLGAITREAAAKSGFRVAVCASASIRRKRFIGAHLIGRYVLHRGTIGPSFVLSETPLELNAPVAGPQANRFALDVLIPARFTETLLAEGVDTVRGLADKFLVSEEAIRRRLDLIPGECDGL